MNTEIPEDIKSKIEEKYPGGYWNDKNFPAEWGYSLAKKEISDLKKAVLAAKEITQLQQSQLTDMQQEIEGKDKQLKESLLLYQNMCDQITKDQQEIERLKGLLKDEYMKRLSHLHHSDIALNNLWYKFKTENQL